VYFGNLEDNSRADPSVLTTCVISSGKLPDKLKNLLITGFFLAYVFIVPSNLCEIIFVLFTTIRGLPEENLAFSSFVVMTMMLIIIIMIKFISLCLVARAVGQQLKPGWAAEASLMT